MILEPRGETFYVDSLYQLKPLKYLRLAVALSTLSLLVFQLTQHRRDAESFAKNWKEILQVIFSQAHKDLSTDVMLPQRIQDCIPMSFTRQIITKLLVDCLETTRICSIAELELDQTHLTLLTRLRTSVMTYSVSVSALI